MARQVRLSLVAVDPARFDDAVQYIETEARPHIEAKPGNLGMSLQVDAEIGVAIVQSYWVSAVAMRESEQSGASTRDEAARRGGGTVSVERYTLVGFVQLDPVEQGAGCQLARLETSLDAVEHAMSAYLETELPGLTQIDGFCGARLLLDPRTGWCVSQTTWRDLEALASSRSAATAIRNEGLAAMGSAIRALEEYGVVFDSARPE